HAGAVEGGLAPRGVAGAAGRGPGLLGVDALLDDGVGLGRVLLEPVAQLLVGRPLHEGLDLGVAELALGLAFELRLADPHGDDGRWAFPDIVTGEVVVLLLEVARGPAVLVAHRRERGPEPLLVGAAADGGDAVGEAVQPVALVAPVPLEGDLDRSGARL